MNENDQVTTGGIRKACCETSGASIPGRQVSLLFLFLETRAVKPGGVCSPLTGGKRPVPLLQLPSCDDRTFWASSALCCVGLVVRRGHVNIEPVCVFEKAIPANVVTLSFCLSASVMVLFFQ